MASPLSFLTLPSEVRMMVYENYLTTEKGYFYDSSRRKVTAGHKWPLALMSTCRTVAEEMRGLPFKFNTIHFATTHCDHMSRKAERFDALMDDLHETEEGFFMDMLSSIDQEVRDELKRRFPAFAPILDAPADWVFSEGEHVDVSCRGYGEVPSLYQEFLKEALWVILDHHGESFVDGIYDNGFWTPSDLEKILKLCHEPWAIPNQLQLTNMTQALLTDREIKRWRRLRRNANSHRQYRFSAAAAAIEFLTYLRPSTRLMIRNIELHEDRPSIAHPASHGLGFIKFCQENPLLRIERQVNLWQCVFNTMGSGGLFKDPSSNLPTLAANTITWLLSDWIVEAHRLVPAGMPKDSYSMVLDGHPIPEVCSRIFATIVHKECTWQAAMEECYKRGLLTRPSFFANRQSPFFTYREFPAAMKHIVDQTSIVRCNFDPGELWDMEEIISVHEDWSLEDWESAWNVFGDSEYEGDLEVFTRWGGTTGPIPEWVDRLREHYFSKYEG